MHYKYKCMENPWVRRPAMLLCIIPLVIWFSGIVVVEQLAGFWKEFIEMWKG